MIDTEKQLLLTELQHLEHNCRINIYHVFFIEINHIPYIIRFSGSHAILSGPAGGVVGYALTTYNKQMKQPVIGFDMGGRQL